MADHYYVKDDKGRVGGPYDASTLRRAAQAGKILPSWHVSTDRTRWISAAKVQNLFVELENAFSENIAKREKSDQLSKQEQLKLFLKHFVDENENYKNSIHVIQVVRRYSAQLTRPSHGFVITEVTSLGVRHTRHDIAQGTTTEIGEAEANRAVSTGVNHINWFKFVAALLGIIWFFWTLPDFQFSATDFLKTMLIGTIGAASLIYEKRQTKVFVGYVLDEIAKVRLEELAETFRLLAQCGRVWIYQLEQGRERLHYKYNAGDTVRVSRLPVALFNRPIPNVETNVRVQGITFHRRAWYFVPDGILAVENGKVRKYTMGCLLVEEGEIEYVEMEGQLFRDSAIIDHRWRYINKDGSRDKRFKENSKLPVVRCGELRLRLADDSCDLMTTDPDVPRAFVHRIQSMIGS